MADSVDELEQEAERRRQRRAGSRNPGTSRFPRNPKPPEGEEGNQDGREPERTARDAEREARRLAKQKAEQVEAATVEPGPVPEAPASVVVEDAKRKRPKSIPFYPNPEHDAFLWRVIETASARHMRIPATAVLRLALSRLEEQMTPGDIVRLLGEAEQPKNKMGRPRL